MRTTAFGLVGRLCRDSRGAVLIKFTIAFLPLLSVAAVAMDVSRALVVKQRFTNAVDAAALAVGRQLGRDDADITALAQGFINALYTAADVGALTNLAAASTATQVDTTATARVGTVFLSILSTPFVDITVSSKEFRQQRKIELVMVLDNSESMAKREPRQSALLRKPDCRGVAGCLCQYRAWTQSATACEFEFGLE